MTFVLALVSSSPSNNIEVISSYGTKDDAVIHAAAFVIELINLNLQDLKSQNKVDLILEVIREYEFFDSSKVVDLWNTKLKPFENDPNLVILESKKNLNMSKTHSVICKIKDVIEPQKEN